MDKMMIHSSKWGDKESLRMIPLNNDSNFLEAIYNPEEEVLVILSKTKTTIPSIKKKNENDEIFYEYYIEEKEDIISFINNICINKDHDILKKVL